MDYAIVPPLPEIGPSEPMGALTIKIGKTYPRRNEAVAITRRPLGSVRLVFKMWRIRAQKSLALVARAANGISTWFYSLVAVLGFPSIPILVEVIKSGTVDKATYLITTAILSATFFFPAEHNFFKAIYISAFTLTIILYGVTAGVNVASMVDRYAGWLLLGVGILHSSERFWRHVVLDRPFPDAG